MNPPTNCHAEVLHALITRNGISEKDLNQTGFRARLSELKREYNLPVSFEWRPFVKFGKPRQHKFHFIEKQHMDKAAEVYAAVNAAEPRTFL